MQKTLLSSLLILVFYTGFAQLSISVEPGVTYGSGPVTASDIGAYTTVTNTSSVPVNLLWAKTTRGAPPEWLSWICDMNNCYTPEIIECPENRPNFLNPGESMSFEIHVAPLGVDGTAEYKVTFFDLSDQKTILASVEANFQTTSTSVNDKALVELRIFPNPTTSFFQINDRTRVSEVVIYNMVGTLMKSYDAKKVVRFDVTDLPEGMYLVRLLDASQHVLRTVRLSKR